MRNLLAACCFVLFGSLVSLPAQAQAPATVKLCNGGQPNCPVISSTNPLPVSGSFSASLGGFHWSASLPPMTNLGSSPVTQAITAGQTIVIQNIGTTNSAFCALGGTTSANATAIPPNSSYSLTSIAETSITCVTPTSTTTLNLQTGTGLWTNAGGGSTGGSGGAVTLASSAVAPGAYQAGAILDITGLSATTAHTCAITGYGMDACLGQIDDDIKSAGSISQATNGTTNGVSIVGVNSSTALGGAGAVGAGAQRVAVGQDATTVAGSAPVKGGIAVVNGGSFYEAVAASQTATVLQSSAGAAGDYLSHCTIYPTSTSPGVVTVFDSTNTAANSAVLFPGGATSLSNLAPFAVPVGANSVNGAWKVTTGANVSVVCYGKFS